MKMKICTLLPEQLQIEIHPIFEAEGWGINSLNDPEQLMNSSPAESDCILTLPVYNKTNVLPLLSEAAEKFPHVAIVLYLNQATNYSKREYLEVVPNLSFIESIDQKVINNVTEIIHLHPYTLISCPKIWRIPETPVIQQALSLILKEFRELQFTEEVYAKVKPAIAMEVFRRKFTHEVGLSPKMLIDYLRIQYASALLVNSNLSFNSIADYVGFRDYFNFSKAFKRVWGVSPREYRNNNANQPQRREHRKGIKRGREDRMAT